jgi:hypothetical protein
VTTAVPARNSRQGRPDVPGVAPVPQVARVSQGTAVEMSRAAAEVLAAIQVAQAVPRDIFAARQEMQEACSQLGLARRAFFAFPRAGQTVSGPTIHLAQELARIWRNTQYGMKQLRVDEIAGETELEAFAWDVQTNTRNSTTIVIPHRMDTKQGPKQLTDARDIYENNANMGSRRMRSSIYRILPKWFTDEAEEICRATVRAGESGIRFDQRVEILVKELGRGGVQLRRIEDKVGRKRAEWTTDDVVDLEIILGTLKRGEIKRDEAFPDERVTADELIGAGQPAPAAKPAQSRRASAPSPAADEEEIPDGVGVSPEELAALAAGAQ